MNVFKLPTGTIGEARRDARAQARGPEGAPGSPPRGPKGAEGALPRGPEGAPGTPHGPGFPWAPLGPGQGPRRAPGFPPGGSWVPRAPGSLGPPEDHLSCWRASRARPKANTIEQQVGCSMRGGGLAVFGESRLSIIEDKAIEHKGLKTKKAFRSSQSLFPLLGGQRSVYDYCPMYGPRPWANRIRLL